MFLGFRTYTYNMCVPKFNISNVNSLPICSQTLLSKTSGLDIKNKNKPIDINPKTKPVKGNVPTSGYR